MSKLKLDFCIVSNPLDDGDKHFIFVTEEGIDYLKTEIIETDEYENALMEIQKLGFIECDNLTFQREEDNEMPVIGVEEIKKVLVEKGLNYNEELEKKITEEFDALKKHKDSITKRFINNFYHAQKAVGFKGKAKHKVPEIGNKITLYFYLFIECRFLENGDCFVNFNGDFTSKENDANRNFISVVKSDFIRIPDENGRVSLRSLKTHKDLFKEIHIYYSGNFKQSSLVKNKKPNEDQILTKTYIYNIMEIKNSIKKENRISIIVDSDHNFDEMIEISKVRKLEKKTEDKRMIKLKNYITIRNKEILEILDGKMLDYATLEMYEKANNMKRNIQIFKDRVEILRSIDKKSLTMKEFIEKCHI